MIGVRAANCSVLHAHQASRSNLLCVKARPMKIVLDNVATGGKAGYFFSHAVQCCFFRNSCGLFFFFLRRATFLFTCKYFLTLWRILATKSNKLPSNQGVVDCISENGRLLITMIALDFRSKLRENKLRETKL